MMVHLCSHVRWVEREENARDPLFYRYVRQRLWMFAALAAIGVPAITSAAAAGVGIGVEPLKLGSGTGGGPGGAAPHRWP
jgi:hypothetical protein